MFFGWARYKVPFGSIAESTPLGHAPCCSAPAVSTVKSIVRHIVWISYSGSRTVLSNSAAVAVLVQDAYKLFPCVLCVYLAELCQQ